jgi:hypothetical protein
MKEYREMLRLLEEIRERLENAPEAQFDIEAVARIELANILARANTLLQALAEDELLWRESHDQS